MDFPSSSFKIDGRQLCKRLKLCSTHLFGGHLTEKIVNWFDVGLVFDSRLRVMNEVFQHLFNGLSYA